MPPTRRQKRWSGRLRTTGALLGLLGAVALADYALGLASPTTASSVFTDTRVNVAVGLAALAIGVTAYWLGRRWRG